MSSLERFYPNGALYARISPEKHEYFYEDGRLKTVEHYVQRRLHGEVHLYWPSGSLKRKCQFHSGNRYGIDQMWDETGKLVDEKDYGPV